MQQSNKTMKKKKKETQIPTLTLTLRKRTRTLEGKGRDDHQLEKLPPELIQEILARLPINYVFQTRYVSHLWYSLTNNRRFFKMHYTSSSQNPTPSHLLIFTTSYVRQQSLHYLSDMETCEKAIELTNLPLKSWFQTSGTFGAVMIVDSLNGLVCFTDFDRHIVVYNPVNGDVMKLPDPVNAERCSFSCGFGYSQKNNEYKVMVLYSKPAIPCSGFISSKGFIVEILTLGSHNWRRIGTISEKVQCNSGVFLNGYLHWLTQDDGSVVCDIKAFNVEKETFGVVPIPVTFKDNKALVTNILFGVLSGCLMIVDYSYRDELQVWVMKTYGVEESWVLEYVISTSPLRGVFQPLRVQKNGDILLKYVGFKSGDGLYSYDPRTKSRKRLTVSGLPSHFEVYSHAGTLCDIDASIAKEGLDNKKRCPSEF